MSSPRPPLPPALRQLLLRAMRDTPGQEICGLLVGHGTELGFRRLQNLGGPGEFWVEETALARQAHYVAATNGLVLGFVHSHATSTQLSGSDACALPGTQLPWLVVAVVEGVLLGQWHWQEGPQWCSERLATSEVE